MWVWKLLPITTIKVSSFNNSQIISVYYEVKALEDLNIDLKNSPFDFDNNVIADKLEVFRLINLKDFTVDELTFKTDKKALEIFKLLTNS